MTDRFESYPMKDSTLVADPVAEAAQKREIFEAVTKGKCKWTAFPSERGYQEFLTTYRLLGELEAEGRIKIVMQRLGRCNGRPLLTDVDVQLVWPLYRQPNRA